MSTSNLQRFAYRGDINAGIHTPWTTGGKSYATNRAICIQVDTPAPGVEQREDPVGLAALIERSIGAIPDEAYAPLPELPVPVICQWCHGGQMMDCPACEGSGGHDSLIDTECDACAGTGQAPLADGGDEIDCFMCEGLGEERIATTIGSTLFDDRLLRLIAALPGAAFALHPSAPNTNPAAFRFDGGRGLLMPMLLPAKQEGA